MHPPVPCTQKIIAHDGTVNSTLARAQSDLCRVATHRVARKHRLRSRLVEVTRVCVGLSLGVAYLADGASKAVECEEREENPESPAAD